jgi:hypothetical protein
MALRALPGRRLAVEDLVAEQDLLARSAGGTGSALASGRPGPACAAIGKTRASVSALALGVNLRDMGFSSP